MKCNFCSTAEPGGWHGDLQLGLLGSELLVAQGSERTVLGSKACPWAASLASGLWADGRAMLSCFRHVQLCVSPWTVSRWTPLSVGFSRQEHWRGLLCHPPGIFLTQGSKPCLLCLLHWWVLYHQRYCFIFMSAFQGPWRHRGSFQSPWGRVRVPWEVLQKPWCVSVWGGLVSPSLLNCSAPVHPSPSPAIGSVLALICGDELRQKTSALGLEKVIPA